MAKELTSSCCADEPWIFYVLLCADGTYYAGVTNDMDRRFRAHNAGTASKYTMVRIRLPVTIVFKVQCPSKHVAMSMESRFKRLRRPKKEEFMRLEGELWNFYQKTASPLYATASTVSKEQLKQADTESEV
jgi:putative endonuclease